MLMSAWKQRDATNSKTVLGKPKSDMGKKAEVFL